MSMKKVLLSFGAAIILVGVALGFHYAPAQTCNAGNQVVADSSGATACGDAPSKTLMYSSGGLISSPKVWAGVATINSSGNWSIDVSSAGFSSIKSIQASPLVVTNGGIITSSTYSCPSLNTCSGTVTAGTAIVVPLISLTVFSVSLTGVSGSTMAVQIVGN